ncbi:cyclin-dependent kinase inhibitor 3-like [Coregonus clupeaformis]|uniref:cyclin-dependent kinase inhibitor 3-like n=1 Tax=Coregonus clupeaformis TaxID=59861 RepID=UPI001E1C5BF1|nr:cyclin-dependent kinase inhibitor 3-like [Coregonus clupeaformis]
MRTWLGECRLLPLSIAEGSQFLGVCPLPECKFKDVRRNVVRLTYFFPVSCRTRKWRMFVFCTRGELHKYRVPSLLEIYGLRVHHLPFPVPF